MELCNETSCASVPPLWKDTKATKTESDLRRILDREWNKNSMNINIQYYKIYWSDNFLMTIRKVEFTESGETTFLTLELGLSLLQLLSLSLEEVLKRHYCCSAKVITLYT